MDAQHEAGAESVQAVVMDHLAAVRAMDASAVAAGFTPDAVFASDEDEAVGQREVFRLFRDSFAEVAAVDIDVRRQVVAGDTAACELTQRLRWASGAELELQLAAFYTVADGLISHVRVYRSVPG